MLLITIVIPNYNGARYIAQTLESVAVAKREACGLAQVEVIVVDGGSTDESSDIIGLRRDLVDRVIIEKDNGQSDAINKGVRHAEGEIIGFLNSDDMYTPNALLDVASAYIHEGSPWISGSALMIDESGNALRELHTNIPDPDTIDGWLSARLGSWLRLPQPAQFLHRSMYGKYGYYREDMHYEFDREHFIRLRSNNIRPFLTNRRLAMMRYHSSTKTSLCSAGFTIEAYRIMKMYAHLIESRHIRDELLKEMCFMAARAEIAQVVSSNELSRITRMTRVYDILRGCPTSSNLTYAAKALIGMAVRDMRNSVVRHSVADRLS